MKKSTISGHLERVRDIVRRAEIEESMRERIFSAIQALQTEVERNRTRVDAVVSVWLQITEAIGGGAKNLEPAANLVEKLTRALYLAKDAEQRPQLPPPPKELSESDPSEASSA